MNLPRIYLIVILLLAFGVGANSQEPPKAVLIDEFGSLFCEDLLARTTVLASELNKDPNSRGYISLNTRHGDSKQAESQRRWISSTLQLLGIGIDRYSFYLEKNNDGSSMFWLIPAGAASPVTNATIWNELSPDTSRKFMFGYADEIDICPTYVPANFAKILQENPGATGQIIIRLGKDPLVDRFWFAGQYINGLVQKYGVPRSRLRLIFRKGGDMTAAEFWFLPARKK